MLQISGGHRQQALWLRTVGRGSLEQPIPGRDGLRSPSGVLVRGRETRGIGQKTDMDRHAMQIAIAYLFSGLWRGKEGGKRRGRGEWKEAKAASSRKRRKRKKLM